MQTQSRKRLFFMIAALMSGYGHIWSAEIREGEEVIETRVHEQKILIVSLRGCGPCIKMGKEMAALRRLVGSAVSVEQLYDADAMILKKYGIKVTSYPTVLVVVDGVVVQKLVGSRTAEALWKAIDKSKLYLEA